MPAWKTIPLSIATSATITTGLYLIFTWAVSR